MYERLGEFIVGKYRAVLVGSVVAIVVAGFFGAGVVSKLSSGGFGDPNAEASRASRILEDDFDQGEPNFVLLVTVPTGVDDAAVVEAGKALTEELAGEEGITQALSYWSLGQVEPLRSPDKTQALVLARIGGKGDDVARVTKELSPRYAQSRQAGSTTLNIGVTGYGEVFRQAEITVEKDLKRAEMIALPLTLVLLVLIFGSVIAASLPLIIGVFAVVGTLLLLRIIAGFTEVSIFALNQTTAMGLGLAIDYSLFVVSRFREEMQGGHSTDVAVRRTISTAGRTVVFSAVTVAASLLALLVFPLAFLRSFAYGGISVVLMAAAVSVIVLPAILMLLGPRVDRFSIRRNKPKPLGEGFWHRVATFVMARPFPIITVVVAFLLFLGAPFLGVEFGLPDDRMLPKDNPARVAAGEIRENFLSNEASPISVVAGDVGTDPKALIPEVDSYARALSSIAGVTRVDAMTGYYANGEALIQPGDIERFTNDNGLWLSVVADVEPLSPEGEALVREVRALEAPFDVDIGGAAADLLDSKETLFKRAPLAGLIIAVVTFIVLFLMFGSLLVPAKAVLLNLLSLSATFGALVWIFQDGNLAGILGFTPTGTTDTMMPVLLFCVAFGLSMDYEVFLLSRIKEEHDNGADTNTSVAMGLERTGRIVTAAAVLIAVVFLAFSTSGITHVKVFGIGLAIAVILDATLIRATLVPAFMRLAGNANWWAPAPLKRIHERFGISEHAALDPVVTGVAPDAVIDLRTDHIDLVVAALKSNALPGAATYTPKYSERYKRSVLIQLDMCSNDDQRRKLLEHEGLTEEHALRWRRAISTTSA
ncbi:MAG: MMPL family transporter [Acidimicrobiales bacterium]